MPRYRVSLAAFIEIEVESPYTGDVAVAKLHDSLEAELVDDPSIKILSVTGDTTDEGLRWIAPAEDLNNPLFEI